MKRRKFSYQYMTTNLTIAILTRNNAKTIKECVGRLSGLGRIVVGDCESGDGTDAAVSECELIRVPWEWDFAAAKNHLLNFCHGQVLVVEPWEILTSGEDDVVDGVHAVNVMHGSTITQPVRLFEKTNYVNPVYEENDLTSDTVLPLFFKSRGGRHKEDVSKILKAWEKREPHNFQINYYKSIFALQNGDVTEFKKEADVFLFRASEVTEAMITMWYYLSQYELKYKNDYATALKFATLCLSERPAMAEFWCLTAEIFARQNQYARAYALYENAIAFGRHRKNLDGLPIEITKYKDIPEQFLQQFRRNAG